MALRPGAGEPREFKRGYVVRIPASVLIPKCGACSAIYFDPTSAARVDAELKKIQLERQKETVKGALEKLTKRGLTIRQVETACGVSWTYLSQLSHGRRLASVTVVRLLEAFADVPNLIGKYLPARGSMSRPPVALTGKMPVALGTVWNRQRSTNLEDTATQAGINEAC
ncbi:MAG: helix-turn-helix transcriptional regulator [Polyangiaceae bacterium]|nr:helix-turn-helix transcriptional regulator [Polyangiaceae bacterium]